VVPYGAARRCSPSPQWQAQERGGGGLDLFLPTAEACPRDKHPEAAVVLAVLPEPGEASASVTAATTPKSEWPALPFARVCFRVSHIPSFYLLRVIKPNYLD
jgi:hypothetical protein